MGCLIDESYSDEKGRGTAAVKSSCTTATANYRRKPTNDSKTSGNDFAFRIDSQNGRQKEPSYQNHNQDDVFAFGFVQTCVLFLICCIYVLRIVLYSNFIMKIRRILIILQQEK
jgi:hypothetical protein